MIDRKDRHELNSQPMIELQQDALVFSFPAGRARARCTIRFQRTLRIPDDNRSYSLPPGLGNFPLEHVEDHRGKVPAKWLEHGGTMLPMYQSEALWINFQAEGIASGVSFPFAVKIAAGKINAVSGKPWTSGLSDSPQDYVVVPGQPWLDGFSVSEGMVRQFVAMPLGAGFTAEEQLTGQAEHGGIQVMVYPMKRARYEQLVEKAKRAAPAYKLSVDERFADAFGDIFGCAPSAELGLAPGGLMKQSIYEDPYGVNAWDVDNGRRCFVHLLNSQQWSAATGKPMPTAPVTAQQYTASGLPWFDYYDEGKKRLPGSVRLAGLDSVASKLVKLGQGLLKGNEPVKPAKTIALDSKSSGVSDGDW